MSDHNRHGRVTRIESEEPLPAIISEECDSRNELLEHERGFRHRITRVQDDIVVANPSLRSIEPKKVFEIVDRELHAESLSHSPNLFFRSSRRGVFPAGLE